MCPQSDQEPLGSEAPSRESPHSLDEVVMSVLGADLGAEGAEAKILKDLSGISKYMCGKITFAVNSVPLREMFARLQILEKPQLAPFIIACRAQESLCDDCVLNVAQLHSLELRSVCRAILKLRGVFPGQIDVSDLEINSESRVLCEVA